MQPTDSNLRERPSDGPAPGDKIRIVSGQLAGLTGVVLRLTDAGSYVLSIDHLTDGVYVVVGGQVLDRL